jgi:hypothetical protein
MLMLMMTVRNGTKVRFFIPLGDGSGFSWIDATVRTRSTMDEVSFVEWRALFTYGAESRNFRFWLGACLRLAQWNFRQWQMLRLHHEER